MAYKNKENLKKARTIRSVNDLRISRGFEPRPEKEKEEVMGPYIPNPYSPSQFSKPQQTDSVTGLYNKIPLSRGEELKQEQDKAFQDIEGPLIPPYLRPEFAPEDIQDKARDKYLSQVDPQQFMQKYDAGDEARSWITKNITMPITESPLFRQQAATTLGSLESFSLGGSSYIEPLEQYRQEVSQEYPMSSTVGQVAGYIGPGTLASKGAGTLARPLLSKIGGEGLKKTAEIGTKEMLKQAGRTGLKYATQEGIAGAGMGLTEGLIRQETPGQIAQRTGQYGLFGAGGGLVFGSLGQLGSDLVQLRQYNKGKVVENMTNFERQFQQSYNKARQTGNIDDYDNLIRMNEDAIQGVKANKKFGATKEVNQVEKTLNELNDALRKERALLTDKPTGLPQTKIPTTEQPLLPQTKIGAGQQIPTSAKFATVETPTTPTQSTRMLGTQMKEQRLLPELVGKPTKPKNDYGLTEEEVAFLDNPNNLRQGEDIAKEMNRIRNKMFKNNPRAYEEQVKSNIAMPTTEEIPTVQTGTQVPMNQRTFENVGKRNVPAYQQANPEAKSYYQSMANYILKEEFMPAKRGTAGDYERAVQGEVMKQLKETGLSYKQLQEGLELIIKDEGSENVARAKKVELVLDNLISKGFTTIDGYPMKPDESYLKAKAKFDQVPYVEPKMPEETVLPMPGRSVFAEGVTTIPTKPREPFKQEQMKAPKDTRQFSELTELANKNKVSDNSVQYETAKQLKTELPKTQEVKKIVTSNYKPKGIVDEKGLANDVIELQRQINSWEKDVAKLEEQWGVKKETSEFKKFMAENNWLQTFAMKKLKQLKTISKFYKNTLKGVMTESEYKQLDPKDFEYTPAKRKESMNMAKERLTRDFDGEVSKLKESIKTAEDFDTAMGILNIYRQEAQTTGNFSKVLEWSKTIRENASTEAGRVIRAHSDYANTPEATLSGIDKKIEDARNEILKNNPKKGKTVDDESKIVSDILKTADKRSKEKVHEKIADDEIKVNKGKEDKADKTQDDIAKDLADRIILKTNNFNKPKTIKEKEVIDQMIDELYKKFTGTLPKETIKPIETRYKEIADAIRSREISGDVWVQAKQTVLQRLETVSKDGVNFKNSKEAIKILDEYFGTGTRPPFSEKLLTDVVSNAMSKLNLRLSDMVKDYYGSGKANRKTLTEYIIDRAGVSDVDAKVLTDYVEGKLKQMKKEYSESYLESLFKPKKTTKIDDKELRDIEALVNVSGLDNKKFVDQVYNQIDKKIKSFIRKEGINLKDIIKEGLEKTEFNKQELVNNIKSKLRLSDNDIKRVTNIVEKVYDDLASEARMKAVEKLSKTKTSISKYNRILELIRMGIYDDIAVKNVIMENEGLPNLSSIDIQNILELDRIGKSLDSDSYVSKLTQAAINKIYNDKLPVQLREKIRGYLRISMLSSPKTYARNILGNAVFNGPILSIEALREMTLGPLLDRITSTYSKQRRNYLFTPISKSKAQILGFKKGVETFVKDNMASRMNVRRGKQFFKGQGLSDESAEILAEILAPTKLSEKIVGKLENLDTTKVGPGYEFQGGRVFKNDFLNTADTFVKTFLRAGDVPFFESAKQGRIAELKKINKTTEVTEEIETEAELYALDKVFQNDSEMRKRVAGLKKSLGIIGEIAIPFTQTPSNILDKIMQYTPYGAFKAIGEVYKGAKKGSFDQKVFIDNLSRSLSGIGIIVFGYLMSMAGIATGSYDKRKKVRDYERAIGIQPYSVKLDFGDETYYTSYSQIQPAGVLFGIGAALGDETKNNSLPKDKVLSSLKSGGDVLLSNSLFGNILDFTRNINLATTPIDVSLDALNQANPNALRGLSYTLDPYIRETYDPNELKRVANGFIRQIPGISKTLPKKKDIFGRDIKRDAQGIFNTMFNPINVTKYKATEFQKELYDVFERTDNVSVLPSLVSDKISTPQGKIVLRADEYIRYQALIGINSETMGEIIVQNENYKNLPIDAKAKILSKIMTKAKDMATKQLTIEIIMNQ